MRRFTSSLLISLVLFVPALGAQPRESDAKPTDEQAAREKRLKQLNDQLEALQKHIATLRQQTKEGEPARESGREAARDESRERADKMRAEARRWLEEQQRQAELRRKMAEQTHVLRSRMSQIQTALAKLGAQNDLTPQEMRQRLSGLLKEQLQAVDKMPAMMDVKPTPATRPAMIRPATRPKQTVLEALAASGKYNTLVALVKAAGIADELKQAEPFTIFAPTDAAFEKLGGPKAVAQLKSDKQRLAALLKDHILPKAKTRSHDVGAAKRVETLSGKSLFIRRSDDALTIGPATIVHKDIEASNGVIQGIDAVVLEEPAAPPRPPR